MTDVSVQTRECWRSILGFEGFYEVSDLGRVRSLSRSRRGRGNKPVMHVGKILKPVRVGRPGDRYQRVSLSKDGVTTQSGVHCLVALAFIGPRPDGLEVCHFDGNEDNNGLTNLRYDTSMANSEDRLRHGTSGKGSKNSQSKLLEEQVVKILEMKSSGLLQREVAEKFNVCRSAISLIWSRKHWGHIGSPDCRVTPDDRFAKAVSVERSELVAADECLVVVEAA